MTTESMENLVGLDRIGLIIFSLSDVTDDHIAQLTKFKSIRRLWLSHTNLTDACIDSLVQIQGLEWVYVSKTQLTASGIDRLHAECPLIVIKNDP